MIYTVTLNPSLDYYVSCGGFKIGKTNRAEHTSIYAGGKGINVSIMLKRMGIESTALGFVAGFTGKEIKKHLEEDFIKTDFIELESGESRINVKIEDIEGTEINAAGPLVNEKAWNELITQIGSLRENDVIVLSGSVPKGMPVDTYEKIAKLCSEHDVPFIVDAEGELLLNVLKYKPLLVKPNHHELGEIYNVDIDNFDMAAEYGKKLKELGARNVMVSMAGQGAVMIDCDNNVYSHGPVEGQFVNGVGAGDSMIAGFLAGYQSSGNYKAAFLQGISAASATAFATGLGDEKIIKNIFKKVLTTI